MGLLQSLKLVPPENKDTTAKPAAFRRARLAARLRKGPQRAVLQAAIDSAARPDSNTPEELDGYIEDYDRLGDPVSTPVSTMAPRTAYADGKQGRPEDKGLAGRLKADTEVAISEGESASVKTQIHVSTKVEKRELWKDRIGNGERIYKRDGEGGMRKPDGFKSPEKLVMAHEHLHLVIAAHVSARLQEFAEAAFGAFVFDEPETKKLTALLDKLADDTRKIVSEWLDQVGVPDRPGEIPHAEKVTEQLLKDGTLERRVRTALLKVVRKNARELAKFRKG
jgi:hypothetical protein